MKATLVKSITGAPTIVAAADAAANTEAATEQTKSHRRTDEGNETVLRAMQETKQSKKNEKDLYTISEEERELEQTYKGTNTK